MSRTTCSQSKRSDKTSNAPNPNSPDFFDNLYNGLWKTEGFTSPYEYEDPLRLEFYKKLASLPFFDGYGKILDVGCGTGGVFRALPRDNQLKKYGIDFSSVAVEEIRRRFPDGIFVTGDAHHLPFPDNFFDRIICTETLEYVDDPAAVVAEMYRVLKEHGKILITVPEESLDLEAEAWPGGMSLHVNKFSMATLAALSAGKGFTIECTALWADGWVPHPPHPAPRSPTSE